MDTLEAENSPLVDYALRGLRRCWLPQEDRWSHIYHLDGRPNPNESLPKSDVFYTLNVLLGLSRVRRAPPEIDVPKTFTRNALALLKLPVPRYAFGTALWASAELQLELPSDVIHYVDLVVLDRKNWPHFRAQDLGMILSGVVAQARLEPARWANLASDLFRFLVEHYHSRSSLFYDAALGLRRRFSSFATQTYLTLACYCYGEQANDGRAIEIANACTRKLISSQGPNGEWPWFFDSIRGEAIDFYEIYSVHQYGMAPAFLEHSERHGVLGARDAIIKGFKWVLGNNQLSVPMLVRDLSLSIRSQARKGELSSKKKRAIRALYNSTFARRATLISPSSVELRLECRSYELGWILWSFGQRSDMPELTHHELLAPSAK